MGDRRFKVDGTPADCARLGIRQLVDQIDWVISGVNAGGNLGVDLWMSGTVAAAREATWLGRRAISISQYMRRDRPRDWDKTAALTERVVRKLIESELPVDSHWNVNLPDVDTSVSDIEIVNAHPEPRHLEVDYIKTEDGYRYQGDYRQRPRSKGSDVAVCFDDGNIAVSLVTATAMP
jgi:5'-nucleotidase